MKIGIGRRGFAAAWQVTISLTGAGTNESKIALQYIGETDLLSGKISLQLLPLPDKNVIRPAGL